MSERWLRLVSQLLLRRPFWVIAGLLLVAATIELAQSVPEVVPGGHGLGEIVRNLSYAIVGALVFQWLVVELPARERRRKTYDFNRQTFEMLLAAGPGLLEPYRQLAKLTGQRLDVWDREAIGRFATTTMAPTLSTEVDRVRLIRVITETGIPRALSQLSASVAYIDPEVAHALSMFPRQDGLTTVLQIQETPAGGIDPERDAHIVWELVEAARRLYRSLLDADAYDSNIFQAVWSSPALGDVRISEDVLVRNDDL